MGFWNSKEGRYRLYSDQERREFGRRKAEEMRKKWHETFVSKTTLLKERGWTEQGIFRFLNGKLVDAGPINAYRLSEITKIEASKDYNDFMEANPKGKRSKLPKEAKKPWWHDCISEPIQVKSYLSGRVWMYEASCPHCKNPYPCFVSSLDSVMHGIAHLWRKCDQCGKHFRIKLSIKTSRIAYERLGSEAPKSQSQETSQDKAKAELAAIDDELANLERKLEPIEQERSSLKGRYIELENRKFGLLKMIGSERLESEGYRDWD